MRNWAVLTPIPDDAIVLPPHLIGALRFARAVRRFLQITSKATYNPTWELRDRGAQNLRLLCVDLSRIEAKLAAFVFEDHATIEITLNDSGCIACLRVDGGVFNVEAYFSDLQIDMIRCELFQQQLGH